MKFIITIALTVASLAGHAQVTPFEVKGVQLGGTAADIKAKFNIDCSGDVCRLMPKYSAATLKCDRSDFVCKRDAMEAFKFGPTMPSIYSFHLYVGKIGAINILFATKDFDRLSTALVEKYGKPTSDAVEVLQNRMGAKFDNRAMLWVRPDATMRLEQRGANVDTGALLMTSKEYDAYSAKKKADTAKASVPNL